MTKQHLFKYILLSAVFDTQKSKYDRRHSDVTMDLTITVFERFCAIVLLCQVWR